MSTSRVPVLSAGFGEGHNAAARAVVEAVNRLHGGEMRAEFRDLFLDAYGEARFRRQRELYLSTANRFPRLWGVAYHALDRLPVVRWSLPFLGPVERQFRPGFQGSPYTRSMSGFSRDAAAPRQGEEGGAAVLRDRSVWTPVARDERLERVLVARIREILAGG